MKIVQNQRTGKVWIGQPAYAETLLQKFGTENAKSASAPVETDTKLTKSTEDYNGVDQKLYQSAVGSLLYL